MKIVVDDLSGPAIAAFLAEHVEQMRAITPLESKYALDLDGLRQPGITFWTVLDGDVVVGCGALKRLAADHAELKSMRTAPARTRGGIASLLLTHILGEANRMGFTRLSLETGSADFFRPARTLYEKFGFAYCAPFGDYEPSAHNTFMTRTLTDVDEHGRPEPPLAGDETATLLGFLDHQRATLGWKCAGLHRSALAVTVGASSMTLGGLLKHLAYVEDAWCSHRLHGHEPAPPWDTVDWAADPDWDWRTAADDTPEQLVTLWQDSVARSRDLVAQALADGGLDRLARRVRPGRVPPTLRWILVHLIEEYARHNGHADLLRESIDGQTGE